MAVDVYRLPPGIPAKLLDELTPHSGPPQVRYAPFGWRTARSRHAGGVNLVMADYSQRFVADDIDLVIWQALSTIAGNETSAP